MTQVRAKALKMAFLGVAIASIMAPAAQAQETPESATESATESEGAPAEGTEPAAEPEAQGATSFSNLCGNGTGKPDGTTEVKKRKGLFGFADRVARVTRKIPLIGDFMVDSANSLSQAVACRLYPEEQEQAAAATQEVAESEEVGKTVAWQSTVRENVSGSSTVESKQALPNGTPCLTITDVVIVDGEELKVSKKMCRLAGAARYTIVSA